MGRLQHSSEIDAETSGQLSFLLDGKNPLRRSGHYTLDDHSVANGVVWRFGPSIEATSRRLGCRGSRWKVNVVHLVILFSHPVYAHIRTILGESKSYKQKQICNSVYTSQLAKLNESMSCCQKKSWRCLMTSLSRSSGCCLKNYCRPVGGGERHDSLASVEITTTVAQS